MNSGNLGTIQVVTPFSLHILLRVINHLEFIRCDAQAELVRIFHNISIASPLSVMVAIDRVLLIINLIAHISFLKLLHRLSIDHVGTLVS